MNINKIDNCYGNILAILTINNYKFKNQPHLKIILNDLKINQRFVCFRVYTHKERKSQK